MIKFCFIAFCFKHYECSCKLLQLHSTSASYLLIQFSLNSFYSKKLVRNLRVSILELEYLQFLLSVGYIDIAVVFNYIVGRLRYCTVCNHLVSLLVENNKSESAVCDIYILLPT